MGLLDPVQLAVPAVVRAGHRPARAVQPNDSRRRVRAVDRGRSRRERHDRDDQPGDHLGRPADPARLRGGRAGEPPQREQRGMDGAIALLPGRPVPANDRPAAAELTWRSAASHRGRSRGYA